MIIPEEKRITLDFHGYTREEVRVELDEILDNLINDYEALVVVHGYHYGQTLLKYVRKEYKHKRIKEKIFDQNPGITILLIGDKIIK